MVEFLSGDHIVTHLIKEATSVNKTSTVTAVNNKPLPKPRLSVRKEEVGVTLQFTHLEGQGIRIFSKRSSEDNFSLLAEISSTEYRDMRPNLFGAPELREYMAYFLKDQKQYGIPSDVVLIIKK